jgi:hypothetical protein
LTKGPFGENIFIWGKEIQIWIGKDSMIILEGLINFITELIALIFEVNLGFNWKKLKSGQIRGLIA